MLKHAGANNFQNTFHELKTDMYVAMAFGKINTLETWIMYEKKGMVKCDFFPSHNTGI